MLQLLQSPCVSERCPWAFRSGRQQAHRSHFFRLKLNCSTAGDSADIVGISRRHVIGIGTALSTGPAWGVLHEQPAMALPASKGQTPSVGSYLPSAGVEDFVEFVPGPQKTPALRAGTVNRENPYRFALPPSWKELKVANIQSGNYCQPRCDEPWTEVIFEDPKEGRATLIVSPLRKLTPKANARLDDIGTVDGIIESLGPYITGTFLDAEDVVSKRKEERDGELFYLYETFAPYGTSGAHAVTAVTTKGDLAFLFVLSANEKQWAQSSGKLKQLVELFRA
eukprot:jgi/Botrbrau1/18209/Bobra.53_1s0068.1